MDLIVPGRGTDVFFKDPAEIQGVVIAYHCRHFRDIQGAIRQQFLGLLQAEKSLVRMGGAAGQGGELPDKMVFTHLAEGRAVLQRDRGLIVVVDIVYSRSHPFQWILWPFGKPLFSSRRAISSARRAAHISWYPSG